MPKPQAHLQGPDLQRGEGLEGVEGSRGDGGDLVVIEREEADVAQAREAVVVDAADAIVPQHPGEGLSWGTESPVGPCGQRLGLGFGTTFQASDFTREALSHRAGSRSPIPTHLRPARPAEPLRCSPLHLLTWPPCQLSPPVPGCPVPPPPLRQCLREFPET